jgi:(heptosyl)LPS beta-1,4-glucosyltransferase
MDPISAVLIVKNEARNLERCLRALAPVADEIVVVDDGSDDGTPEIARRLGARVVQERWRGFGPQKNFANGVARHAYVLSIDADEVLDEALQAAILTAKERGLSGAYELSRLNWYYGRFLWHGNEYPDRKVRLFPKASATWSDDQVHERLLVAEGLPVTRLAGHLLHFTYRKIEEHAAKINRYTTLAAEDAWARGRRPSLVKLVLSPIVVFLKAYVLKRGFLDGRHGFVLACMHASGTLLKYAKPFDLERLEREQAEQVASAPPRAGAGGG